MAVGDYYVDENGDYYVDDSGDYVVVAEGTSCCCGWEDCDDVECADFTGRTVDISIGEQGWDPDVNACSGFNCNTEYSDSFVLGSGDCAVDAPGLPKSLIDTDWRYIEGDGTTDDTCYTMYSVSVECKRTGSSPNYEYFIRLRVTIRSGVVILGAQNTDISVGWDTEIPIDEFAFGTEYGLSDFVGSADNARDICDDTNGHSTADTSYMTIT